MNEAVIFFSKAGENFCAGKIKKTEVGATEIVAKKIATYLAIPSYPILPVIPYPNRYEDLLAHAQEELLLKKPIPYRISNIQVETLDKLFLGYPNWYGSYPQIIATFLADYCFDGKVVVPFCTHEGNRFGHSLETLKENCPLAVIQKGLPIRGSRAEQADKAIEYWLQSNGHRRNNQMAKHEEVKQGIIFPIGEKNEAFAEYFIGQSYLQSLIADPQIPVGVSNVTFEPGCRNNWHIHHDGFQLLLVTGGEGWYQEAGKEAQRLKAGDVITTHDGVKHWHGATKDSWFEHIAITAGTPEWLEPVTAQWYDQL